MMRKTAVITGASSGMGKAVAVLLKNKGYDVFAGARRVDEMSDLEKLGIHTHYLDVSDSASNANFYDFILANTNRIDVLINSAGYGSFGALEDVPVTEAKRQLEVNVFGAMELTQLVLPTMRTQRYGKIINISSIGGQIYSPLGGWYYASKHALEALSDTLRLEVKDFGIDVIIIEPGGTATNWQTVTNEKMLAATPPDSPYRKMAESFTRIDQSNFATSEDIAQLIWKSINAKNPKTRYQLGFADAMVVFLARKLSYKLFDKIIRLQMKNWAK